MNIKKKHIILLLIAGCTITAVILQFFEMSLTIRSILVTVLILILFFIRAILANHDDKPG